MNFFMFSKCGEGAGLMKVLQEEGNICAISILEKDYSNVYDGILKKSDFPDEDAIMIFDSSGMGARADSLKAAGYKVFGASKFHDRLESDRDFGLSFMEEHGILIPETKDFTKFSEGVSFVKENKKKRYVFKPSGKNLPCKLTYSSSDAQDLIHYMNYVEKNFGSQIDEFILQEFIEGSIISSEYWVGVNGFISPINHTIEVKKFMNDDIGPSTGCSGNIVWRGSDDSEIALHLGEIENELVKQGYIGPIDINCIVSKDGSPYGLEWTPRFGLDAMPTFLQLLNQDVGKLISDSFNNINEMDLNDCFAGGVRITIPPYPIEYREKFERDLQKISPNVGIPIRGFEGCEDNCYFYEIMRENDLLVHSSGPGVIACVSDLAMTPEACFEFPYDILEECKIPDKQYRTDLDEILPRMYKEVKEVMENVYS